MLVNTMLENTPLIHRDKGQEPAQLLEIGPLRGEAIDALSQPPIGLPLSGNSRAKIELVQNAPAETDLLVPGIRKTSDVWTEMINGAHRSIHLEQFYLNVKAPGSPGDSSEFDNVLGALKNAGTRGVPVEMLVDSKFYSKYPTGAKELEQVPNIKIKTVDFTGGIQHSKFLTIDGKDAFAGSANFDWVSLAHVHEIGLHVSDPNVAQKLDAVFTKDWDAGKPISEKQIPVNVEPKHPFPPSEIKGITVLGSPASSLPEGVQDTLSTITDMIDHAKDSIQIQVYEYGSKNFGTSDRWQVLNEHLRNAAANGKQVELLVDKHTLRDGKDDLDALSKIPNAEVHIVSIPKWSGKSDNRGSGSGIDSSSGRDRDNTNNRSGVDIPFGRVIHSKYMIIDHRNSGRTAWVGTENWQGNYFTKSRNVGMKLTDQPKIVDDLEKVFTQVWNSHSAGDYKSFNEAQLERWGAPKPRNPR